MQVLNRQLHMGFTLRTVFASMQKVAVADMNMIKVVHACPAITLTKIVSAIFDIGCWWWHVALLEDC